MVLFSVGHFSCCFSSGISHGAVWFTEQLGNKIGRMTSSGKISEFRIPSAGSASLMMASGAKGAWFIEPGANEIAQVTPAGKVTEFSIPTKNSQPDRIARAADGAIWFTAASAP